MMRWLVGFVVFGLLACASVETEPEPAAPQTGAFLGAVEPGQTPALYVPGPVEKNEVGDAALVPPPIPRTRVRMHMDQLENSLTSVLGGLEWVDKGGKSNWAPNYSSLGVPDYMDSVREVIEPALLFDKLLGDASRDLCPALLAKEKGLPIDERVFLTQVELTDTLDTSPDLVEDNLSLLLLRFHGRHIPVGDERLTPWKTLFGNTLSLSESTETAWTAVCVALLIHPEFSSR